VRLTARSTHSLVWRQILASTAVIALVLVIVIRVNEAAFYSSGGARGLTAVVVLLKNPAISALYGRAASLQTAGAFVAWKTGMYLALAVAVWAALMATRVTRGAEDDESWDLLVVGRRGRGRALATVIAVLGEGGVVLGVVTFLTLILKTPDVLSCALFSLGITGVAWCGAAIGLIVSQVVAPRRSASQVALSAVGLMFLVRMIADSSNSAGWLRWLTIFGWLENLGSFQHHAAWWVAAFLVIPALVAGDVWRIQKGRDLGCARWTRGDRAVARTALLGSAWGFSWRERRSTLTAWSIGLMAFGLIIGYLTHALVAFCRSNPAYVRLLDRLGFSVIITAKGFVGEVCFTMTLAVSFMVLAMLVMLASDDQQGRLDLPLANGTGRLKWMLSAVVATSLGTLMVSLLCGLSIWAGVEASGTSMKFWYPLVGMVNAVSTTPLLTGVAVLFITIVKRFAYISLAALVALAYLLALLGPILHWPHWLLLSSPFYYLRLVPAQSPNWGAIVVCSAIGLVVGASGFYRFSRADLGS
jgi:ABC-2 type transport system permease protein